MTFLHSFAIEFQTIKKFIFKIIFVFFHTIKFKTFKKKFNFFSHFRTQSNFFFDVLLNFFSNFRIKIKIRMKTKTTKKKRTIHDNNKMFNREKWLFTLNLNFEFLIIFFDSKINKNKRIVFYLPQKCQENIKLQSYETTKNETIINNYWISCHE